MGVEYGYGYGYGYGNGNGYGYGYGYGYGDDYQITSLIPVSSAFEILLPLLPLLLLLLLVLLPRLRFILRLTCCCSSYSSCLLLLLLLLYTLLVCETLLFVFRKSLIHHTDFSALVPMFFNLSPEPRPATGAWASLNAEVLGPGVCRIYAGSRHLLRKKTISKR